MKEIYIVRFNEDENPYVFSTKAEARHYVWFYYKDMLEDLDDFTRYDVWNEKEDWITLCEHDYIEEFGWVEAHPIMSFTPDKARKLWGAMHGSV